MAIAARNLTDADYHAWCKYPRRVAIKAWKAILGRAGEPLPYFVENTGDVIDAFHHLQAAGPHKPEPAPAPPARGAAATPPLRPRRLLPAEIDDVAKATTAAVAAAEGWAAGLSYFEQITDLCAIARCPELATQFLAKRVSIEATRSRLLDLKADRTDSNPISALDPGRPTPEQAAARGWARAAQQANQRPAATGGPSPAGRRADAS